MLPEQVGPKADAADESAQYVFSDRVPSVGAVSKVNDQDFAVVTVHGG
jgi:hypothetical protein